MATNTKPLKITAVGDGYVGKTCLLISYTTREFPEDYVPTVFENYPAKLIVDGQEHNMTIWDTAGQEDYERLRPLSYPNTTCFLLCFSVASRASYDNIRTKWAPELRHHASDTPVILIATKTDIRNDPTEDTITTAEGKKMRDKIKAIKYFECSAKTGVGLDEIFVEAVRSSVNKHHKKRVVHCVTL